MHKLVEIKRFARSFILSILSMPLKKKPAAAAKKAAMKQAQLIIEENEIQIQNSR